MTLKFEKSLDLGYKLQEDDFEEKKIEQEKKKGNWKYLA